jgi:hypothetical protein
MIRKFRVGDIVEPVTHTQNLYTQNQSLIEAGTIPAGPTEVKYTSELFGEEWISVITWRDHAVDPVKVKVISTPLLAERFRLVSRTSPAERNKELLRKARRKRDESDEISSSRNRTSS